MSPHEIKFQYILKDVLDGEIHQLVFTIIDLEMGSMRDLIVNQYVHAIARRQYTGLEDKNGVEIYEGDIVRYTLRSGNTPIYSAPCVIIFKDGKFIADGREDLELPLSAYEVIGNVHQTSDLLNGATV